MRGVQAGKVLLLAATATMLAWAQPPTILSLQSSFVGGSPADVTGITSGVTLQAGGFHLYVNMASDFSPGLFQNVTWQDTSTNITTTLAVAQGGLTATQVKVFVPNALYQTIVATPVPVKIVVHGIGVTSNAATFTINPPLQALGPVLPAGTLNQPYTATYAAGGTPPYVETGLSSGVLPLGLNAPAPTVTITGTPTQTGVFNVTLLAVDSWGSNVLGNDYLEIVDVPTILSLLPNSLAAGTGTLTTVTVNGSNFVGPAQAGTNILPSSQVQWQFGSVTTPLVTTFVGPTQLTAVVPTAQLATAGTAAVTVTQPGNATSNALAFLVLPPVISSVTPATVPAGSGATTLTVNGANFVFNPAQNGQSTVLLNGVAQPTVFINSVRLTATVPAALLAAPGVVSVQVVNPGGSTSAPAAVTASPSLTITTTSVPPATAGVNYSTTLTGRGGTPPYTWAASGFPVGLSLNAATGVLAGVPQSSGSFALTVVLRDAVNSTATAQFAFAITPSSPPALSIATSSNLPSGIVGVAYLGSIFASGGTGPYTFSLAGGGLPDGLSLSSSGYVTGTPGSPGRFPFSVAVADAAGATASAGFTIVIEPAPLTVTGGPTGPVPTGTPITITFGAAGGVPPYRFSPGGNIPPGTAFSGAVLAGTPTATGAFTFRVNVADSRGTVASKDFTLTVTEAVSPLSLSGRLGNGKVGVPYTGQLAAAGGTGPYSYTGTGLPDGLSLSGAGAVSGTPGTAGQFSLIATVTDSKGATASGTFGITIAAADLTIATASLPDGTVGVAYSAALAATGGLPPYAWTVAGLPDGVTATGAGAISGTPKTAGKFTVLAGVKDAAGASASKSYSVTIAAPALTITTTSAPNATVGAAYTANFAAAGGTAPYTFSATGLPAGLSISAAGAVTGTPTAPGAVTIVVTVKDAAGVTASKNFAVTVGLPAAPPLTLNVAGVTDTAGPLQQPRVGVSLGNSYPVDVVVTLTLTFTPDSGPDDPTIQFSSGGRTARITVPAGATSGATDVGAQTGSVAGTIAITAQLQAGGQDVTPSPAPRRTIRIAAAAPVIVPGTLTAVRNATGFTVTLTGYATNRELTQAVFQFTAASGSNLQTTTATVPLGTLFAGYFTGAGATPFGSQFTYTQPFTVTGSVQAVTSVTVTLVNSIGSSAPATATLN